VLHRVAARCENHGNRLRRRRGEHRHVAAEREHEVRLSAHQLRRQLRQPLGLAFRGVVFDGDIAPLDVAQLAHPAPERLGVRIGLRVAVEQDADPRRLRRLRPCRARCDDRRRRAAERSRQRASCDVGCHATLPLVAQCCLATQM
jgi:hypothetical protein